MTTTKIIMDNTLDEHGKVNVNKNLIFLRLLSVYSGSSIPDGIDALRLHARKRKRPQQYQTDWYGEYGRTWAVPVQLVRQEIMGERPGFDVMSAADSAAGLWCLGRLEVRVQGLL